MKDFRKNLLAGLVAVSIIYSAQTVAADESIIMQSTTSTANSGLYDYLLPKFKQDLGITVHVVAVGTGQAIKNARNCDADVLLVHAKSAEEKFVKEGFGVQRFDVMYNDFVIVGPANDPAGIKAATTVEDSLSRIAKNESLFLSRGDNSGTHKKELALWKSAQIDPQPASGKWYRETGSGMGATLNVAVGMQAYVMTDRATWISFGNRQDFRILYQGDNKLFNQYGVIMVSPDRCEAVKAKQAKVFIDWILSSRGQQIIGQYKLQNKQLFFPNAG
jgi:tungstate transport system substrate-binding protein